MRAHLDPEWLDCPGTPLVDCQAVREVDHLQEDDNDHTTDLKCLEIAREIHFLEAVWQRGAIEISTNMRRRNTGVRVGGQAAGE